MSHTPTGSKFRSRAEQFAEKSPQDQVRQWRHQWTAINSLCDSILEQIEDEVVPTGAFNENDLYPRVPLAISYFTICMLGFTPSQITEDTVITEALFSRLPSVANALSPERALSGQPA